LLLTGQRRLSQAFILAATRFQSAPRTREWNLGAPGSTGERREKDPAEPSCPQVAIHERE
jgi:hypothetical protein